MKPDRVCIAGVPVHNLNMAEALSLIEELVRNREPSYIVTPNADHIIKLQQDTEFQKIYAGAACVLPDGMPLLWAGRFLRTPLKERVSGADLVPRICARAAMSGFRLFFLGGKPGAAEKVRGNLEKQFPSIRVVGICRPAMGLEDDEAEYRRVEELIREAGPDILLVGFGAPKQEKWIYRNHKPLGVPVSIGVGGTIDVMAGMSSRAPYWMQRSGLEWFWRFMHDPRRLWKRYLIDDMHFFQLILTQKLGRVLLHAQDLNRIRHEA